MSVRHAHSMYSILCIVVLRQVAVQPAQDATEQAQGQSVDEAAGRCFFCMSFVAQL